MKPKLTATLPLFLLLFVSGTVGQRQAGLKDWQKRYLEKIQLHAREGGLPEEEWKGITKYNKDLCYEQPCLSAALEIMQATNFTVDPCEPDKWLNFACSRRVNGVDNINQLERLMGKVALQTKKLLEHGLPNNKRGATFLLKEAQVYYQQCKNKKNRDKKDVQEILSFLTENYGEWPMMSNRDPGDKFNWLNMVADLNRIKRVGFTPSLLNVILDQSAPQILLRVGKTSFPGSVDDLVKLVTRVQKTSGVKRPARLDQFKGTNQFLNFVSGATLINAQTQIVSIDQLQKRTDQYFKQRKLQNINVNWLDFFQRVLNGTDIQVTANSPQIQLPLNQILGVLEAVNSHFDDEEEIRSVSNALNFQFASMLLQESTNLMDDLNSFKCTEQVGSREDICYARTTEIFGYSLGKTYLSAYYNKAVDTPAILSLMSKIQEGYIDAIMSYDWMENSTKAYLKDKIESMKTYIAEPDWTQDPKQLRQFYAGLDAAKSRNSSYPRNYLAVTNWQLGKERSWAHKISQFTSFSQINFYDIEWSRYLGNVQAQYHKAINQARIEGGIVHAPLFDVGYPGFMNFGGLGMVLAHEIGHSFDTQGRTYNKHGDNSKEWWDETSVERYNKWVESILEDYGNEAHQVTDTSAETIDPMKTINEDIADILGVYISHFSYQEYLHELEEQGKQERMLPGLQKFTPQQLFYMKYTNMWCDKKDVQNRFNDLLSDHSSGNTRATVPLKRSKEFAQTFGCPIPKQFDYKK